jgi:hypothetical protein
MELNADLVATEMDDFEKSMIALRLELPDIVWRDVWRRWCGLRRLIGDQECSVSAIISRVCERGTKGCRVRHIDGDAEHRG